MPQGRLSELEVLRDLPGYQAILRTILKSQIKQLVEQLSFYAGEEAILLSASLSDGTLSHIGSESGEFFLNTHDQLKKQFLGFCMKRHRLKTLPKAKTKADDANATEQQIKRRKLSDNGQKSQNLENIENPANTSKCSTSIETVPANTSKCSTSSETVPANTTKCSTNSETVPANTTKCSTNNETVASSKNTEENTEREATHAHDDNTSESVSHEQGDDGEARDSDEYYYTTDESDDDSEESESDSESAAGSGVDLFYFDGTNVVVKQEVEDPDYMDSATDSKRGRTDRLHTARRKLKAESDVSVDDVVNAASSVGEDSTSSLNDISNKDQTKLSKEELIAKYGKYVRRRNVDVPKIKYRRNSASFQKKYQAILAVESGAASKCEVARQFGVPQNTLSSWIKAADQIKQEYLSSDYDPTRERARKSRFPDIEKALLDWARDAKTHNIPLATAVLIDRANEIARSLGYSEEQFTCKVGWADRFKLRFGLNVKKRRRSGNPFDS